MILKLIILHTSVINLKIVNLIKHDMIRIVSFYLHLQFTQRETVEQSVAIKSRVNVGVWQQQIPSFLPIFILVLRQFLLGFAQESDEWVVSLIFEWI